MKNFGEIVPGYNIPVLNEREVRAAAGMLFFATFLSLMFIVFRGNFIPIKYVVTFFLTDFIIRVFVSPRFSPTLIVARMIVSNQTPEYVGAPQKKFAWIIGVALAATMFTLMVVMNTYSIITGLICLVCLIFLFFESVFGICLGCLAYPLFFKEKVELCPGDACEVKEKHEIQKISVAQILTLLVFVGFIFAAVHFFNDAFGVKPHDLFEKPQTEQVN